MERHANKTNVLETVKVPLQRTTKTGRTIFAYLRRSTSKIEQSESLIQQEDGIFSLVNKLGLNKQEIRYFAETYSGFENKRRKKWGEMINEIDKLKEPCIILARDISRLSRNPTDSQGIMDRLYGDNKHKIKIDKIYTLDYENIKEWNKSTDKDEVHKVLSAGYYDSLDTRRKSIGGILLKLENGEFPYKAPKGLESFMQGTKRMLRQNDKMPFVRKAFEMKVAGITHKEISKYLKKYGEIKLSDRELTDRLFKNAMYIGEYTEKTTGLHYPQSNTKPFLFVEGVPPIKRELWEKVQRALGRKNSQYGEGQEGDILAEKLRTESGKRMSKYLAKGKYPNYKNTIDKINIAETQIIRAFISEIKNIIGNLEKKIDREFIRDNFSDTDYHFFQVGIDELIMKYGINDTLNFSKQYILDLFAKKIINSNDEENILYILERIEIGRGLLNDQTTPYIWSNIGDGNDENWINSTINKLSNYIKQIQLTKTNTIECERNAYIHKFQQDIQKEKTLLKNYIKMRANNEITIEEMREMMEDSEITIKLLEDKIIEFSANTDMEKYLEQLPNILRFTFELTDNAIQQKDTEVLHLMMSKLVEITTVELTINNKKELKIKLFEVLDGLISSDSSIMEAPPGVEPGYKALQASA